MVPGAPGAPFAELEDFVEAFESVRSREAEPDLAAYLPARDHPLYLTVLSELVRVDLDFGWRERRPRGLADYQRRFPELFQSGEHLREVAFEEYRLRQQLGDAPPPSEYARRWGVNVDGWPASRSSVRNGRHGVAAELASSRPSTREAGPDAFPILPRPDAAFPEPGATFLDFRLVAELGRGTFGRVYLAEQKGLYGRHVVLKVASTISLEAKILVQLQHTNIVPVYSVHSSGPLQALCMPFLGRTTLADVLKDLHGRLPQSGKALADAATTRASATRPDRPAPAEDRSTPGVVGETVAEPVYWKQLEHLTYVQAVATLAVRLADGLAHAHERGILHRDLKPANVLLTEEGQPMLLDFNLSRDVKPAAGSAEAFVGGTLPYMAPEHLLAFRQSGGPVDARGDVYSLGVILYELLTGRLPFPPRTGAIELVLDEMIRDRRGRPPRMRGWNRAVSPAVESIVRHCLEPNPARRYHSARELQEDLQRHLENRPLRHAAEVSRVERTAKWVKRHPRLALAGVTCVSLVAVAALVTALAVRSARQARWEAAEQLQLFRDDTRRARVLLATSAPAERRRLDEGTSLAVAALDRYRVRQDAAWWSSSSVRRLPSGEQESLREDAGDLLLMLASVAALQAGDGRPEGLRAALEFNRLSESCYDTGAVPAVIGRQRGDLTRRLDPSCEAAPATPTPGDASSAKDLCLNARDLADHGRFAEALPLWRRATRQGPADLWAWAGLAACYDNMARYEDAAASYGTCIALAPEQYWLYFKRGVAYLGARSFAEAGADFDRFLTDRPDVPEGYINRALAREGLGDCGAAIRDVTRALDRGTTQTRAYFIRALLNEKSGNAAGAREDREKGARLEPTDELSCVVRGLSRFDTDPRGALADFDRALRFNPRSLDGLQNKASVLSERLGQSAQAVAVLDRAVELYPHFVPARAGRGVLLARLGKRKEAIRDAEECLQRDVRPATLYQVAGIYALTSRRQPEDREEALFLLSSSLRKGYGWDLVGVDTDLDPIRNHPEFRRTLAREEARRAKQ